MTHNHEHGDQDAHQEITVETLSTPPVKIRPAPLSKRIVAGVLDSVIVTLMWMTLIIASNRRLGVSLSSGLDMYEAISFMLLTFTYYFLSEGLAAATIGKAMLKLRVVDNEGDPCSLQRSLIRNLVRFIDWLPVSYAVAGIAVLASNQRQRLGDRLAGTIVSTTPEKDINPPPAPFLFH